MTILTIRTDKPEAEIGLFEGDTQLAYETWQAHRQLAETLHSQIATLLQSISKDWANIDGIVVFQGPGSFTGLRIGISVANALAYSLQIPIVGATDDDWIQGGVEKLKNNPTDKTVLPEYGAAAHITQQKK